MITEEEAKKKWCPHSFFTGKDAEVSGNREWHWDNDDGSLPGRSCIGSACMAWRSWKISNRNYDERIAECRDGGMTLEQAIKFVREYNDSLGYCGLAGKP